MEADEQQLLRDVVFAPHEFDPPGVPIAEHHAEAYADWLRSVGRWDEAGRVDVTLAPRTDALRRLLRDRLTCGLELYDNAVGHCRCCSRIAVCNAGPKISAPIFQPVVLPSVRTEEVRLLLTSELCQATMVSVEHAASLATAMPKVMAEYYAVRIGLLVGAPFRAWPHLAPAVIADGRDDWHVALDTADAGDAAFLAFRGGPGSM